MLQLNHTALNREPRQARFTLHADAQAQELFVTTHRGVQVTHTDFHFGHAFAPIGVWLGIRWAKKMKPDLFFKLVHAGMFLTGLKLLWDAFGA